ncbi:uncharacterized protein LOC110455379 [Rhizophagus irregularis DAOM 181602=DAOM 197198]|nr:uncharacterized protein LOC110455379 [Rhizophagus irregularis DAOM 181602=DAOM 197198]
MQFMASSLANLAKNLGTDKPLTKRHFKNFSSEHIDLITRKGFILMNILIHMIVSRRQNSHLFMTFIVLLEERSLRIITNMHKKNSYGWTPWEASPEYFKQNPDKQKQILNVILNTKPDATHLPPAVDSIAVKKDKLSPYITKLVDNLDGGRFPKTEKLVPHLDNWLAPYIAKNTNLRQQSKNSFEKDFFKLMNNSVYGKTMENVRKYQDVKLMRMINENDEKKFLKKVRKPSFKYARQLGNTLVGAHMGKASVILNKPIIIGASVLGLSKLLMYRFWYGFVKRSMETKYDLDIWILTPLSTIMGMPLHKLPEKY